MRTGGNNLFIERKLRADKRALGWKEPPRKGVCRLCGKVIIITGKTKGIARNAGKPEGWSIRSKEMPEEKVTILKRALMTEEEIAGKIKENWFSSVFHLSEIESRSLADLMIIGNDGRVALLEIKTSRYLKENLKNVSLTAEKAERLTEAGKRFGVPVYVVSDSLKVTTGLNLINAGSTPHVWSINHSPGRKRRPGLFSFHQTNSGRWKNARRILQEERYD